MITFGSAVGPDIMMFDKDAHLMMELMGKEPGPRGVVTVERIPEAIAGLRAAIAADKANHGVAEEEAGAPRIGLAQRALPLLELLELSRARDKPVTWGV